MACITILWIYRFTIQFVPTDYYNNMHHQCQKPLYDIYQQNATAHTQKQLQSQSNPVSTPKNKRKIFFHQSCSNTDNKRKIFLHQSCSDQNTQHTKIASRLRMLHQQQYNNRHSNTTYINNTIRLKRIWPTITPAEITINNTNHSQCH